jgi:hypothetical protein
MTSPFVANTSGNEPITPLEEETEQRHRLGKSSLDIGGLSANSSTDTLDRLLKNESEETLKEASRGNITLLSSGPNKIWRYHRLT